MEKTERFIEDRIKWRASRHNLPNKSVFLFEDLNDNIRSQYLAKINESDTGKVILLFTDSKKNWTALGTKMIVGFNGTSFNSVSLSAIKDVDPKIGKNYVGLQKKVKPN